ncbi:MAG TPA: lipopolysaccharide kinase InaA family protein [Gemmatimonas sp.]|nr:lipopolysaccharide kinase InaA family protein [Gemmatimonas sp.]
MSSTFELVAHDGIAAATRSILEQHGTLYQWAASLPQARALHGRAPVYVGEIPLHDVPVAVRHVWHGGLLAPLTSDRFRAPTRAPRELANSLRLRAEGIPTTELLAYALYPAGPGLRRVDVATRFIPDAVDLGLVLAGRATGLTTATALAAAVPLLHLLAARLVVHPDLNVKNILLVRASVELESVGSHTAHVIDVDVIQFMPHQSPADVMRANLSRLLRSVRKWQARYDIRMGAGELHAFERNCLAFSNGRSS